MEFCKLLVECQADVNAKDAFGFGARPLEMLLKADVDSFSLYLIVVILVFFSEQLQWT
jgi:hypothetical protein